MYLTDSVPACRFANVSFFSMSVYDILLPDIMEPFSRKLTSELIVC